MKMKIRRFDFDLVYAPDEDGIECEVSEEFAERFKRICAEHEVIQEEARKIQDKQERQLCLKL